MSGDVQRAEFLRIVLKEVRKSGTSGYVENLDDGAVKILAQGDTNKIDAFVDAIKIEYGLINVEEIQKTPTNNSPEYSAFKTKIWQHRTRAGRRLWRRAGVVARVPVS